MLIARLATTVISNLVISVMCKACWEEDKITTGTNLISFSPPLQITDHRSQISLI